MSANDPATVDLRKAWGPNPANFATGVEPGSLTLTWNPGTVAGIPEHDVYFGTTDPPSYIGRQATTNYTINAAIDTTYYWRIDEVEADGTTIHEGTLWRFSVTDHLVVDDIESYGDNDTVGQPGARIWYTWKDGFGWVYPSPGNPGNATGSWVDVSTSIVHFGTQSLKLDYKNGGTGKSSAGTPITAKYSEVEADIADLEIGPDWTKGGVETLVLWFNGNANNAAEPMYVALSDGINTAVVVNDNPNVAQTESWETWNIPLQKFVDAGNVDLTNIAKIGVGFGIRGNMTTPGGSGTMYFDDIRLYPLGCINPELLDLPGDLNLDCVVNMLDFALFAGEWLVSGMGLP